MLSSEAVIANGKLLFHKRGAGDQSVLRTWIAEELGTIQNIADLFVTAVEGEADVPAARSLQPFDVEYWQAHKSDDALPVPQTCALQTVSRSFMLRLSHEARRHATPCIGAGVGGRYASGF
jgi:hypothetical protein